DYDIATGEMHSGRECCELAFAAVGRSIRWQGAGAGEKGVDKDGETLIEIDPRYFRPAEVELLCGDASKARRELGWQPTVLFEELVQMMVAADLEAVRGHASPAKTS